MPRKSKLSPEEWKQARADRETGGASFGELEQKYGVSGSMLARRAKAEGWGEPQDVQAVIRAKVQAKVQGTDTFDPAEKAAAIDAEADRAAAVLNRHRAESRLVRTHLYRGLGLSDQAEDDSVGAASVEAIKLAKLAAEAMAALHRIERQAWNLDAADPDAGKGKAVPVLVVGGTLRTAKDMGWE